VLYHYMVKKAMKIRLVLMMVVVFAILAQAMVQEDNPSFFNDHYLNHPPSLTHFLHSLPSISLSPYNDAKPRMRRSKKRNRPKKKKIPGSVNTLTKEEKQARSIKFEEAVRTCRKECAMQSRETTKSKGNSKSNMLWKTYDECYRDCMKRELHGLGKQET
jgi:hypothetical protein